MKLNPEIQQYDTITQRGMISEETLWLQAGCFFPRQPV